MKNLSRINPASAGNRPTTITQPDNSLIAHSYNKAGLLESIKTQIKGAATWTNIVTNINYNEKGQRTEIYYDNGSKTKYAYDEKTFRLNRLLTTRNTGADILQDINYTYDPEGNITEIEDNARQTFYYSNSVIEPRGKYYYDALYRLTKASGRELSALAMPTHTDFANNIPVPNTAANAMQNYTQQYFYDELGNIQQMQSIGQWTRDYFYNTGVNSLKGHTSGNTEYTYDEHGNTLSMPHLATMNWDYKDQLHEVDLGGGGTAYYTYDASGERVRKVIVKTGGIVEQRIYFGGWEIYRKTISGSLDFERETLRISDDRKAIVDIETKTVENGSNLQLPTSNLRFQYDNHLGSASLELDSTAAIISYEEYHPFGTTSYRSGRTETEVSLKRYKYVGKERDEETGLYYYGARYYAGWIARFVSVDPLQHKYPHYTPYQYAGNKPVSYIDLDGLEEGSVHKYAASLDRFKSKLSKWNSEASKTKYRRIEQIALGSPEIYSKYENVNRAKLRIFAHDITAEKQIINTIGSYNKSFGKFINAGLPLDLKHFINAANIAFSSGEFITKKALTHREYRQALDAREGGRTSSFTPEDILSNYLGSYFGSDLNRTDDFETELVTFLNETKTLFSKGNIENGKYLTQDRISELKDITQEYYGTGDLTKFQIGSEVYNLDNVKNYNKEAEERIPKLYELEIQFEYLIDFNNQTNYKRDTVETKNQ